MKYIHNETNCYEKLCSVLIKKYLVSKPTAQQWVGEYFRFLALLCIEKDYTVPSTIVEIVWKEHVMFYEDYTSLSMKLFEVILYPERYSMGHKPTKEWQDCYVRTIRLYTAEYGFAPNLAFWEKPEVKFQSCDQTLKLLLEAEEVVQPHSLANYRIELNVYRMVFMLCMDYWHPKLLNVGSWKVPRAFSGTDYKANLHVISVNKKLRLEFFEDISLKGWRSNYPH